MKAPICLGQIPPKISDAKTFLTQSSDSPWIQHNPLYSEVLENLDRLLPDAFDPQNHRRLLVELQRGLAELNLLSHKIVKKWPSNAYDLKYEKFKEILDQLRKGEQCKVIVFAFFKGTLQYLFNRLNRDNISALIISEDVDPDDRSKIIENFQNNRDVEVLLSSRVGSEGLDFQFCNTLFNYDLPWNPMEVEQRIGRLDRIGQELPFICEECGTGIVKAKVFENYRTKIKGYPFVVDKAMIGVCDHCGAKHYDANETKRWEDLYNKNLELAILHLKLLQ